MKTGRCKHYNGEVYRRGPCNAGVKVRERTGGSDAGWLIRTPCFKEHTAPALRCEHYTEPTAEELAAEKAEQRASIERIGTARLAILEVGAKPRSAGNLPCPVCKAGTLHWTMASNKHIHARCSTAGCVAWME
jgi:hypothetical protein